MTANTAKNEAAAAAARNSANDVSSLIDAVMTNAASTANKQAQLTKYMFDAEVSFDKTFCDRYNAAKGGDKTAIVTKTLSEMSPRYANTLRDIEEIKGKKDKTDKDGLRAEALKANINAANSMFARIMPSLTYLRSIDCTNFKVRSDGSLAVTVKEENGELDVTNLSGRALTQKGMKLLAAKRGGSTTTIKPAVESVPREKAFLNALQVSSRYIKERKEPIADASDEIASAADVLLLQLLMSKFEDKGVIEIADLKEYLSGKVKIA